MQSKKKRIESAQVSSLPVVEVLVVITITTALLLGVIIATNPLGTLLSSNQNTSYTPPHIPFPSLDQARERVVGGMSFTTAMNDFPQVIGGYIAPYQKAKVGDPFYLEVALRDRIAPITEVIARIEGQEPRDIPLKLIDGTEQDGTWGAVWEYTGDTQIKIISYDEKNNVTEVGIQ